MKCREAQYWLYSFRPNASWPVEVVGHLQHCSKCQLLQTKLKQIDQGVDKLTSAAGDPAAMVHLLGRIAKTPQAAAPKQSMPGQPWRWVRAGAWLTGAAALLVLGWFVGRQTGSLEFAGDSLEKIKTVTVFQDKVVEKIVQVHSPAERILFATLLKRNARLVQSPEASDRLDTLLDMADDCRLHAWTLIDDGPRDALPTTIDLYVQLLRDGVLAQLVQAPAEARPALQQTARTRLKEMADAHAAPKALPSALAEQREAMQNATDETIKLVEEPDKIKTQPKQTSPDQRLSPTATLVRFAVTVSSETDPVVKADRCTHFVKRLLPTMNLYLSEDAVPQRGEMGQQFGELIQFGVYRPLELASAQEPAPPVEAKTKLIREFAAETIASMEKSLEQAPQDARQGWQKALEATKKSQDKSKGKGKGKGKGPRDIRGTLQKIDGASATITVSTRMNGKNTELTYALTKDLLSAIAGKATSIADVKIGAGLQLRLSNDRKTVLEITPRKREDDGDRNQP